MQRNFNTNSLGLNFEKSQIIEVWKKGISIGGYDPNLWRKDKCGSLMSFNEYGNRNSDSGWEIDHINPVSNGGNDNLNNLQPLNWKNNLNKSDKLDWNCNK